MHTFLTCTVQMVHIHLMKLAEWMEREKLTDEAFAERVGADRTYIGRIRRGLHSPSLALMARIKGATGGEVTADDLLPQTQAAE